MATKQRKPVYVIMRDSFVLEGIYDTREEGEKALDNFKGWYGREHRFVMRPLDRELMDDGLRTYTYAITHPVWVEREPVMLCECNHPQTRHGSRGRLKSACGVRIVGEKDERCQCRKFKEKQPCPTPERR